MTTATIDICCGQYFTDDTRLILVLEKREDGWLVEDCADIRKEFTISPKVLRRDWRPVSVGSEST